MVGFCWGHGGERAAPGAIPLGGCSEGSTHTRRHDCVGDRGGEVGVVGTCTGRAGLIRCVRGWCRSYVAPLSSVCHSSVQVPGGHTRLVGDDLGYLMTYIVYTDGSLPGQADVDKKQ